jgi:hypothetical protein
MAERHSLTQPQRAGFDGFLPGLNFGVAAQAPASEKTGYDIV